MAVQPDRYMSVIVIWGEGGADERAEFGPYDTQSDGFREEQITEEVEAWKAEHPDRRIIGRQVWGTATAPEDETPDLETVP